MSSNEPSKIKIPIISEKETLVETVYAIVVPDSLQRTYLNIDVSPLPNALFVEETVVPRSVDGAYRTSIGKKEFLIRIRVMGKPAHFEVVASIMIAPQASSAQKLSDTVFASLLSIMLFIAPLAIRHTALKKAEARRVQEPTNEHSRGA